MLLGFDDNTNFALAELLPHTIETLHLTNELLGNGRVCLGSSLSNWIEEYLGNRHVCAPELREITAGRLDMRGKCRKESNG